MWTGGTRQTVRVPPRVVFVSQRIGAAFEEERYDTVQIQMDECEALEREISERVRRHLGTLRWLWAASRARASSQTMRGAARASLAGRQPRPRLSSR